MSARCIKVFAGSNAQPLWVGTLRFDAEGSRETVAFCYAETWLASVDRYNIDPMLVLGPGCPFHIC